MTGVKKREAKSAPTPVDDVRRVRERLSREAGGDVRALVSASKPISPAMRKRLGLKLFRG
jgi:hypothetical protein